jgi:hypothetical protein
MDRAGFIEVAPAASTILGLGSRFDLDLALHVAWCYVRCVAQAKRHARGRWGHARAFDVFTDFDCVWEHALDTIDPSDQVIRSGWAGSVNRSVPICWSAVTALLSMTRQAAGVMDYAGVEPKPSSCTKNLDSPLPGTPTVGWWDLDSPRGC